MTASGSKTTPCIGFLTVVEGGDHGVLGGYLVLNTVGRPLEFHCTAPVKANRAQEILFGPTLQPFLYGEQIARTLITKSKLTPLFVCTDQDAVLAARPFMKFPVTLVEGIPQLGDGRLPTHRHFTLGGHDAAVAQQFADDGEVAQAAFKEHDCGLDLVEPFGRIREALEEAKRGRRDSRAA